MTPNKEQLKKFHFRNVDMATWVRIVTLFVVLANQIALSVFDTQLVPFEDAEIYEGVSTGATFLIAMVTAWRNNSFTEEAQEADRSIRSKKGSNRKGGE